MGMRYESWANLPPEPYLTSLLDLLTAVFSTQSKAELTADLTYQITRTGLHLLVAIDNERIVACKLGNERKPGHFYSWLGCVSPDYRGRGIAAELMRRQHAWCQQQGYHTIRNQTYNQWRDMLILNLRFGFDIIGTVQGKHGLTIVLEKAV